MRVLGLLGLSVYDDEAGSSLIVYTKFERVSLNDRQTDRQTDKQTDRQMHCCHMRKLAYFLVV